jgi:hypothetical protein
MLGRLGARRAGRIAVVSLASLAAALAVAAPAMATEPTGNYKVFKDCPYEKTEVKQCVYSETNGGEVVLGSQAVPIVNKILLQGGSTLNFETEKEQFYAAKDGNTLSKVAQPVPGGLTGFINESSLPWWLKPAYKAVLGVNAVTELAKPASEIGINATNLAGGEGVALTLPVKVHLENLFLGSNCYIGSSTTPVTWNLTTGKTAPPEPNKPISGETGSFEFLEEGAILKDVGNKLVDNAFSVPAASGCGGLFSIIVNPILDLKIGLPSKAGNKNSATLTGNLERGYAPAVRESVK